MMIETLESEGKGKRRKKKNSIPVHLGNFIRAESDDTFRKAVHEGAFGHLRHARDFAPLNAQSLEGMHQDTLDSSGVFDLQAAPLRVTLPNTGTRFMSMQVISQDHYTVDVVFAPGTHVYTQEQVGSRYVFIAIRTFVNVRARRDLQLATQIQNQIITSQSTLGNFEIPLWDPGSLRKCREALKSVALLGGLENPALVFGNKSEVDPIRHLFGTAFSWGESSPKVVLSLAFMPQMNDGKTLYSLTFKDVPVEGFWSVSVYNAKGFIEPNALEMNSLNSLAAKTNVDGSYTIQFGACQNNSTNCLPITPGWNYTVRLYRPRNEILQGSWKFPEAQPLHLGRTP